MHWVAVFLATYAAGFVELWRLCETAPLAPDAELTMADVELPQATLIV